MSFEKFLRTPILQNTHERLFWIVEVCLTILRSNISKQRGLKGLALKGLKFKNEFRTLKNIQISFYIQLPTGQSCDICYTREKNKATAKNSVSGSPNVPGSHMQTRKYKL